jgi:hypothetical protein
MIKKTIGDLDTREPAETPEKFAGSLVATSALVMAADAMFGGVFGRSVAAAFSDFVPGGTAIGLGDRLATVSMLFHDVFESGTIQ